MATAALVISVISLGLSLWALMMARQTRDVADMMVRGRRDPFLPFNDNDRRRRR